MNKLLITKENLIGDEEAVKKLSSAESARILILSDSHGNYKIVKNIIMQYGSGCDALVFCGDCVKDIYCLLLEAFENDDLRKNIPPVISLAAGNCDSNLLNIPERNFSMLVPDYQLLSVGTHNFYVCHGHRIGVDYGTSGIVNQCKVLNADVALYGHTHVAKEEYYDNLRVVNPGSCARPRGGQNPCFAIITAEDDFINTAFIQIVTGISGKTEYRVRSPIY